MRLGPFKLDEQLGKGGMGTVWRGVHVESGAVVAVKVLSDSVFEDGDVLTEFRHEVRAASRLDHRGIVDVYDAGQTSPDLLADGAIPAGCPYMVLEYVPGGTLRHAGFPRDFQGVRRILLAMLDALAHAHARDVIHRDLKPLNILVTRGDDGLPHYKLTDFGIAHALDPRGRAGVVERRASGTAHYMAPEQILGRWRDQGPWTDLYALGCLAFQLTTGRPPFVVGTAMDILKAHLREAPPPYTPMMEVPDGFELWLGQLLVKRPERRYTRAADAMLDLLDLGLPLDESSGLRDLEARSEVVVASAPIPSGEPGTDSAGSWGSLADLSPAAPTLAVSFASELAAPVVAELGRRGRAGVHGVDLPDTWQAPAGPPRPPRLPGVGLGLFGLRRTGFVGRIAERDRLWAALRATVTERRPHVVLLEGDAGVGKSRLAEWTCERTHELGVATVLEATHSPGGLASDGLSRMIANHLRCADLEPEEVGPRIDRWFEDAVQAPADPLLRANLLDIVSSAFVRVHLGASGDLEETAVGTSGVRARRHLAPQERFAALTAVLRLLTRLRPVALWLDDLHWGLESLLFCGHLLETAPDLPILVVGTVRVADLEGSAVKLALDGLGTRTSVDRVPVVPLDPSAMRALLGELLALTDDVAEDILGRAGGYPRFAVEMVSDGVRRGVLVPTLDGFRLKPGARFEAPEDLQELVARRLQEVVDQTDGDARAIWASLELAAVLGLEVDLVEWAAAARLVGFAAVGPMLDRMLAANIALRRPHGWAFASSTVRDALLDGAAARGTLAEHHRRCALVLHRGYGEDLTVAERLGAHLAAAGDHAAAVDPLRRSALASVADGDFAAAERALTALSTALTALDAAADDPRRAAWVAISAWCFIRQARLNDVSQLLADHPHACAEGAPDSSRALALHVRAYTALRQGRIEDGLADYAAGQLAIDRTGDLEQIARFRHFHAIGLRMARREAEAEAMLVASVRALEALGMRKEAGTSHLHLGMMAMARKDFAEAGYWLEETERLYTEDGYRLGLAFHANTLGELHRAAGDIPAALAAYERFEVLLSSLGSKEVFVASLNRGYCLIDLGRFAAARAPLLEARRLSAAVGFTAALAGALAGLAAVAGATAEGPDWDEATASLLAVFARARVFSAELSRYLELGAALIAERGDPDRARAGLLMVRGEWDRMGNAAEAARVAEALAALGS